MGQLKNDEMAVRMPPVGRTSASQRTSGQTCHLKSQLKNTARCHWPNREHSAISSEPSIPQVGGTPETIDTPSAYKMDEEMQADQELLTTALDEEERAYNAYKNKIDKWNTQGTIKEPKNRNAGRRVTNHNQIEGTKQNSNQPNKEMQHKTPARPLSKMERTPDNESQGQHKNIRKKTEELKEAINTNRYTQNKQTRQL